MRFLVKRANDDDPHLPTAEHIEARWVNGFTAPRREDVWAVEIETLDDLLLFKQEVGHGLIIEDTYTELQTDEPLPPYTITIYDGYVE